MTDDDVHRPFDTASVIPVSRIAGSCAGFDHPHCPLAHAEPLGIRETLTFPPTLLRARFIASSSAVDNTTSAAWVLRYSFEAVAQSTTGGIKLQ